jgi:hypothetical protein
MAVLNDIRNVYYVLAVGSEQLTTTGNYATITSYNNTGFGFVNVAITFFGVTTAIANGAYTEITNRVSSRDTDAAVGYDQYAWITSDL